MNDRACFMAAIRAHPDEDTPRLAFADWLQENGDPLRAAYIRKAVAGKHKPHTFQEGAAATVLLAGTEIGSPELGLRLIPVQVAGKIRGVTWTVARGFIERVRCDGPTWVRHGDELRAAEPVLRVALTSWPEVEPSGRDFRLVGRERLFGPGATTLLMCEEEWPDTEFEIKPAGDGHDLNIGIATALHPAGEDLWLGYSTPEDIEAEMGVEVMPHAGTDFLQIGDDELVVAVRLRVPQVRDVFELPDGRRVELTQVRLQPEMVGVPTRARCGFRVVPDEAATPGPR